jgi:hypothetical protein
LQQNIKIKIFVCRGSHGCEYLSSAHELRVKLEVQLEVQGERRCGFHLQIMLQGVAESASLPTFDVYVPFTCQHHLRFQQPIWVSNLAAQKQEEFQRRMSI